MLQRNVDGFGESDEESFIRKKVCTVTIHSVTSETAHTYHLLAAYLAVLDAQLVSDGHVCKAKPI